jgi:hypothetical protein
MFRKAYGFLDDYQEKEILALKVRVLPCITYHAVEALK